MVKWFRSVGLIFLFLFIALACIGGAMHCSAGSTCIGPQTLLVQNLSFTLSFNVLVLSVLVGFLNIVQTRSSSSNFRTGNRSVASLSFPFSLPLHVAKQVFLL